MPALHDFKCLECGYIFEQITTDPLLDAVDCEKCGKKAVKTFEYWEHREFMKFPEGRFHGLFNEPYITSRRQLREELKKEAKDEYTECYSKYDDGYSGI